MSRREFKDLTHAYYLDPGYIRHFLRITKDNALDYFAWSQFYDKDSNNEKLRIQYATSLDKLK